MLNHIILMGRLTRDPEYRTTSTGKSVCNFSIAVDRDFSATDEKETDFIDIVAWRKTAEFVLKYFAKGSLIAVSGRLQIRNWTDKEGGKRRTAEVVAESVYFAGAKKDGGQSPQSYTQYSPPAPAVTPVGVDFPEIEGDDSKLPF